MDVELTNLTSEHLKSRAVAKLAKRIGRLAGLPKGALISIVFVDAAKMQEINKNYRDKDEPTDVLSFLLTSSKEAEPRRTPQRSARRRFGFEKDKFITPKFVRSVFGEVFLCPEIIRTRAAERGMGEKDYQKLLIVHAMLHLKGMHHQDQLGVEKMEEREKSILDKLS